MHLAIIAEANGVSLKSASSMQQVLRILSANTYHGDVPQAKPLFQHGMVTGKLVCGAVNCQCMQVSLRKSSSTWRPLQRPPASIR